MTQKVENVNILGEELLPTPREVKANVALTEKAKETILRAKEEIRAILDKRDSRLLVVIGPCSIHDTKAAREYASRLKELSEEVSETMCLVMRTYFEKPRTAVGWKGLINDPFLDDSFQVSEGLHRARKLLLDIAEIGLGTGTEVLDPVTPQYLDDLIAWSAIGARTTESQTHREIASGLSTPVGFKNGTDGNIEVAVNALRSSSQPHCFLGVNHEGQCTILKTSGNSYGHIVLRGGKQPNYDSVHVALCEQALQSAELPVRIMVDCSHGNSLKDPTLQPLVLENCVNQILEGNTSLIGVMLESNLGAGRQDVPADRSKLAYGVSITDGCIDWDTTAALMRANHEKLLNRKS